MRVIETVAGMKGYSRARRGPGETIALVPTMGYLHDGHMALLERGREVADVLVLSVFVNPAQFGPNEDFDSYPRDASRDLEAASRARVDAVFMPPAHEMYPEGFSTFVEVTGLTGGLCGRSRPGHFRGVATVVAKLFNIVGPDFAVFGRKDYQQLRVISRMVRDLDIDVEIIEVDTVREPDGLAMSSRNRYLSGRERQAALVIPRSLEAAAVEYSSGVRDVAGIVEKMKKIMADEEGVVVEYIEVRHPETLDELAEIGPDGAVAAVAARVGGTRLIDNRVLGPGAGPAALSRR